MGVAAPARKDRFTALDTLAVVRELRNLGWARVEKAYDLAIGGVAVSLRSRDAGRRELVVVPGRFVALLRDPPARTEELSTIAKELRRLLTGAILSGVADPLGERYLELEFRRADVEEPLRAAVELFGTGNLTIARGPKIVAVLHARNWAHRSVRVGAEYSRPPSRGDPFALSSSQVAHVLQSSRSDRASTLGAKLSLGGPLAEEILARSGLDPVAPAGAEPVTAAEAVQRAMVELVAELGSAPRGFVYDLGGEPVDAEPFESRRWSAEPGVVPRPFPTFSEAAWEYFSRLAPAVAEPAAPDRTAAEAIDRKLIQQREAVARLDREAADLVAEADAILAHYPEVEAALAARSGEPPEDGRWEVALEGRTVHLLPSVPIRASAQALYEEAKRTQVRLSGARRALEETERSRDAQGPAAPTGRAVAGPDVEPRARFWFQKFRWFLSSEGVLVVGGRDAASNDLIVRRYLRAKDRYVHADLHGAPSVIVKHPSPPGPDPGEVTLREAGQFGVAFSKAWRAGLAAGSAFWVEAEQVSKSAASGEFVARGAWVIHGTKHVLKDLPTEIGIGKVRYDGAELWCAGPPEAIRARGTLRVILVPGEERDRAAVELDLTRELGLSRDRIQSLLPPGGVSLRRA